MKSSLIKTHKVEKIHRYTACDDMKFITPTLNTSKYSEEF